MEYVMCTTKHAAKNHKLIFFHNDTRIFGDWVSIPCGREKSVTKDQVTDPMHRFFRDIIFGSGGGSGGGSSVDTDSGTLSRLRLSHSPEARIELDIQVSGVWYQRLLLELDGTSTWPGQDGGHVICKTYWKMRKLVILITSDVNGVDADGRMENKMLVISVAEEDASQLKLALKWKSQDSSDSVYRKSYKRVTSKEIFLVDHRAPKQQS